MPSLFSITTTTNTLRLDEKRQGDVTFTVSNASEHPMRGRALLQPEDPNAADWLHLKGDAERDFPETGTERYTVTITVPKDAPPGNYALRLDMVNVKRPDEDYTRGQTITIEVPETEPKKKPFPWWKALVAAGVLLLGVLVDDILRPGNRPDIDQQEEASFRLVVEAVHLLEPAIFPDAGVTVVTGRVESGSLRTNDSIWILSADEDHVKHSAVVPAITQQGDLSNEASVGEQVGLVTDVSSADADVGPGDIVVETPENAKPPP